MVNTEDLREIDLANKDLELSGWTKAWENLLHIKADEGEGNQKDWHLSRWSYSEGYKKALEEILDIISKTDKENGWEENPVTKHRAILVLTLQERIRNRE